MTLPVAGPRELPGHRVAIIGGGLAGMATAAALIPHGFQTTIFEAKRRTGGRAGSFTDQGVAGEATQEIDYCQHVAMGCCTNFLHLMRQAGLEKHFLRTNRLVFTATELANHAKRESVFCPSPWLPAPLQFGPSFCRLRFLSWTEKRQVASALWRLMRWQPTTADPEQPLTMADWLRAAGQSQRTIDRFWNVVIASALGDDVRHVAVASCRQVFVEGFLANRRAADVLVPQQPLSQLFGQALPQFLSAGGVQIQAATRVRNVCLTPTGQFQLAVTQPPRPNESGSNGADVFDSVVVAVPWYALKRLLGDGNLHASLPQLEQLTRLPTAPISGIHLWLDRPLTSRPHTVIVDRLSQWVFRSPLADSPAAAARKVDAFATNAAAREGHYYQVVVSAAHDLRGRSSQSVLDEVRDDLRAAFPQAGEVQVLRGRVVTDPSAVFSVSPQVEALRPVTSSHQAGFFVAGDFTRTGWPATMEGAVISGFQAADCVAARCGIAANSLRPSLPKGWLARVLIAG
ncbi:hydroxysqualene dehydroxylase HpnE [Planctomycetaceae bacterium SH139]